MTIKDIQSLIPTWISNLVDYGYLEPKKEYTFTELLQASNEWAKEERVQRYREEAQNRYFENAVKAMKGRRINK